MDTRKMKVIQTEVMDNIYDLFREALRSRGLTIKEAAKQAIIDWSRREIGIKKDSLFNTANVIKGGKKTDSSKIDKVVYSKGS